MQKINKKFKLVCLMLAVMMVLTVAVPVMAVGDDVLIEYMGCCEQATAHSNAQVLLLPTKPLADFGYILLDDGTYGRDESSDPNAKVIIMPTKPLADWYHMGLLTNDAYGRSKMGDLSLVIDFLPTKPLANFGSSLVCEDTEFANEFYTLQSRWCCGIFGAFFSHYVITSFVQGSSCGSSMCHTHIFVQGRRWYNLYAWCDGRFFTSRVYDASWDFCQMLWR